ncbi:endonuclease/exonuclease/phosphatase family protein [Arthrobacter echini]|uniref:Endonuclease/exonuclease/phosphatase family protein n=1 Tax=Arthrobacter echini TaxID=1529066 RepID=A0A4S5EA85_9MICC|nr:endonuclease/exonuclease/phosphatase family protein [Arthrobacter echini]THJ68635.1 endonuclease/exonuclease/phosphatase family protein [Arthrobacter echini]
MTDQRIAPEGAMPSPQASPPLIGTSPTLLHVMSFNIRYDRQSSHPGDTDHWPDRVAPLQDVLRREVPTVLGVQEALHHQVLVVEASLPSSHRMIGMGRNGGSRGEYSAIFYDAVRLELIEWDQFWLSDIPRLIGSSSWGNKVPRIVTWGRFRDTATDQELLIVNTHFDHESENARQRSASAVLDLVRFFHPRPTTIVMGDFNSDAGSSSAYRSFVSSGVLADTWAEAEDQLTPDCGTYPRYEQPILGSPRIDWILTTPEVLVRQAGVNPSSLQGRYASDHAPVQVLLDVRPR